MTAEALVELGRALARRGYRFTTVTPETHRRVFTEQQLGDLPIIPRRRVAYRDTMIEEMDLDAILDRHPKVVHHDEYAHTNAPPSRNDKRWQDNPATYWSLSRRAGRWRRPSRLPPV